MGIASIQNSAAGLGNVWSKPSQQAVYGETVVAQPKKANRAETEDVLELSAASQAAADALGSRLGTASIADLFVDEEKLKDLGSAVQAKLTSLFSEAGIDTSKKIDLRIGSDGQVIVANDHPQKAEIEQLIKDHPKLRDQFAKYSAQTSLFHSMREGIAFQKAYARDPAAAVAQFSHLFDGSPKPVVSMVFENGQYQTLMQYADGRTEEVF